MTTNYYIPPACISGAHVRLPDEEAYHAVRVLRRRAGDEITAVDGEGGWYRIRLESADRREVHGTILERRDEVGEPQYRLTLGMALLKNTARFETVLEKSVELGVSRIVPLITSRTERAGLKTGRAGRILRAALKQCGRSRLPVLDAPTRMEDLITREGGEGCFLCHEQAPAGSDLAAGIGSRGAPASVFLLIGPEGGFDDEEVESACAGGWTPVRLGPRRLRAETAALAALSAVMVLLERA